MSSSPPISRLDAIVLAGGESKRMGTAKANLPFGDTTLTGAVVATLRPVFRQVFVVTRDRGALTGLDVEILEDESPLQGPLAGLTRGLAHSGAPWCFVTACDMPFLQPEVIEEMAKNLGESDVVVPGHNGRLQTLHAFYARGCLPIAEDLLGQGITSLRALIARCRVTELSPDHFTSVPGALRSFRDLDTAEEYRNAFDEFDPFNEHST